MYILEITTNCKIDKNINIKCFVGKIRKTMDFKHYEELNSRLDLRMMLLNIFPRY